MPDKYSRPPHSFFAAPGAVRVSASALRMAREFSAQVGATMPGCDQVIAFDWADSRFVRRPAGGPRVELGPGLDIVAYDRADIPADVIQTIDGFDFAVRIPKNIYEARSLRLIDIDAGAASGLTLL